MARVVKPTDPRSQIAAAEVIEVMLDAGVIEPLETGRFLMVGTIDDQVERLRAWCEAKGSRMPARFEAISRRLLKKFAA